MALEGGREGEYRAESIIISRQLIIVFTFDDHYHSILMTSHMTSFDCISKGVSSVSLLQLQQ